MPVILSFGAHFGVPSGGWKCTPCGLRSGLRPQVCADGWVCHPLQAPLLSCLEDLCHTLSMRPSEEVLQPSSASHSGDRDLAPPLRSSTCGALTCCNFPTRGKRVGRRYIVNVSVPGTEESGGSGSAPGTSIENSKCLTTRTSFYLTIPFRLCGQKTNQVNKSCE